MDPFRTKIKLEASNHKIKHGDPVVLLGSCFAEHIGEKLIYHKFKVLQNPFGILYNPVSLSNSIEAAIDQRVYSRDELNELNGVFSHYDFHGRFNEINAEHLVARLNENVRHLQKMLLSAKFLIVSLGTSFVFKLKSTNQVVANCHKYPQANFSRERLSTKQIIQSQEYILEKLRTINPNLNWIFTVSPVRHYRDGYIENNRSKSSLLLAVDYLIKNNSECSYFPSFEILLDELRDYRFFDKDMIHPSDVAIDYIWDCFQSVYMSQETIHLNRRVEKIQRSLAHRPMIPNAPGHRQFLVNLKEELNTIHSSNIDFSEELNKINGLLG